MSSYLVLRDGVQDGPYDLPTLQMAVESGQITLDHLIWQDGMTDWLPLHSFLKPAAPAPGPPPVMASPQQPATPEPPATPPSPQRGGVMGALTNDDQDPAAVEKIMGKIGDILTADESVEYVAVQKKPVVTIAPDAVVLTNKRFIIARPKLTGFSFEDYLWREVADVHMSEQMIGATISCALTDGRKTAIDSLPKKQARRIYQVAQQTEEQMFAARRERDLEDKRAAAGGVVIQSPTQGAEPGAGGADPMAQLSQVKQMLDAGLITAPEYEAKKAEILSRM